jgi:hydroxyacylglutathione hydrolase
LKAAGMKGTQELGAKQMYQSINKFDALQIFYKYGQVMVQVLQGALGAVPSTTVGYEKMRNWAFNIK